MKGILSHRQRIRSTREYHREPLFQNRYILICIRNPQILMSCASLSRSEARASLLALLCKIPRTHAQALLTVFSVEPEVSVSENIVQNGHM